MGAVERKVYCKCERKNSQRQLGSPKQPRLPLRDGGVKEENTGLGSRRKKQERHQVVKPEWENLTKNRKLRVGGGLGRAWELALWRGRQEGPEGQCGGFDIHNRYLLLGTRGAWRLVWTLVFNHSFTPREMVLPGRQVSEECHQQS